MYVGSKCTNHHLSSDKLVSPACSWNGNESFFLALRKGLYHGRFLYKEKNLLDDKLIKGPNKHQKKYARSVSLKWIGLQEEILIKNIFSFLSSKIMVQLKIKIDAKRKLVMIYSERI